MAKEQTKQCLGQLDDVADDHVSEVSAGEQLISTKSMQGMCYAAQ